MKKATLVLATAVAFLLSVPVFAAQKVVTMPSTGSILSGSTSTIAENGILKVTGSALVGEYIPGVKNAIAIVPETKIASSAISNLVKGSLRGGVVGVIGTVIVGEIIDGVGWVIDSNTGKVVKSAGSVDSPAAYIPSGLDYKWDTSVGSYSSATSACTALVQYSWGESSNTIGGTTVIYQGTSANPTATCTTVMTRSQTSGGGNFNVQNTVSRSGNSCPAPYVYSSETRSCTSTGLPVPLSESDYDVIDGFVKNKDGTWQRQLATELC